LRGIVGEKRRGKETDRCPLTMTSQINVCRSGVFPTLVDEVDDQDESLHKNTGETDEEA
jgi:hypothetical protein